jgi:pimeloyl-ACP methyl ester carboxylesterase
VTEAPPVAVSQPLAPWTRVDWSPYVRDEPIDGRTLRFLDYGDGPALVLVHGLGGTWQGWLENILPLAEQNRVIAIDMPGFGVSEPLPPKPRIEDYSDTVAGLLDRLEIDSALVCGHSLGGLVSTRFALDHPDRLTGLALVNAGGVEMGPVRIAIIVNTLLAGNAMLALPGVGRALALRPRLRRLALAGFLRNPDGFSGQLALETLPLAAPPGFADAAYAGAAGASDVGAERVAAPTLLLWGRHDRIIPLARAEELAARLPDARLEVFDGAGHCPMFECPEEFNPLLSAFAAEVESLG